MPWPDPLGVLPHSLLSLQRAVISLARATGTTREIPRSPLLAGPPSSRALQQQHDTLVASTRNKHLPYDALFDEPERGLSLLLRVPQAANNEPFGPRWAMQAMPPVSSW
ncbi:hypothetical protein BDY21DRAFT_360355 [Lineolata rhizophorae]|uniref:Uncharacterized protein n=1 Tax=Lineolata rhizophorae TaxID=578093 RepID=A0A6A6PFE8_9PEZI|nr:hypothetical protein BDY21DRAFT_360355 [Lineolata rhizophorae]